MNFLAIAMKQPISRPSQHLVCLPGGTTSTAPGIQSYARITAAQRRQDTPQQHFHSTLKRLKTQGDRINQLATELEDAIAQFKETALQANQIHRHLQAQGQNHRYPTKICDYHAITVPFVYQSSGKRWLLAARRVDLCKAEREAARLAQCLRRRK
ncbi:MAG: hypothetical protein ACLFT0_13750 [Spirulinaceae cyanobacterium]